MLQLDTVSKAAIERAIKRAKTEKPKVIVLGTGVFNVASSAGGDFFYSVVFYSANKAQCDCQAHKPTRGGKSKPVLLCKHIVSCQPIYTQQLAKLNQAETDQTLANIEAVASELKAAFGGSPASLGDCALTMCKVCKSAPADIDGECQSCYEAILY